MSKGRKHSGKVVPLDRNRAAGPWQPFQGIPVLDEWKQTGVLAAFQNNRYRVYIKGTISPGFLMAGPDGQPQPVPVTHLIVVTVGGRAPTWADLQRIKNELVHEESDAVEIFPAASRDLDMPQTHLWCLPPGYPLPLGLLPKPDPNAEAIPGSGIRRADMEFLVIETPSADGAAPVVEVFADAADAEAAYVAQGIAPPEGFLLTVGHVPHEDEGAAWSAAALERRAALMDRIAEAGQRMAEAAGDARPEGEALADAMREGIAEKAEARDAEAQRLEAAREAEARADLDRMRARMVRGDQESDGGADPS